MRPPEIDHTLAPSLSARLTLEQKLQILGDDMPDDRDLTGEELVLKTLRKHIKDEKVVYNLIKDLYYNTEIIGDVDTLFSALWRKVKDHA